MDLNDLILEDDTEWNIILAKFDDKNSESFEKLARKKAKDPVQEHLREKKQQWNEFVSKFIETLKALKKGMNGYPVPAIGIGERSKITQPLPNTVIQLIDHLAQEYSKISSDAQGIVQEQSQYASQFLQQRPKPATSGTSPQTPQPSVTTSSFDVALIKEASNPLSRLWTYIKMPFQLSDKDRWVRKDLLVATTQIKELVAKLDDIILTKNYQSAPKAVHLSKNIYYHINNDINDVVKKLVEKRTQLAGQRLQTSIESGQLPPDTELPIAGDQSPTENISVETPNLIGEITDMENNVKRWMNDIAQIRVNIAKIPGDHSEINRILGDLNGFIPAFFSAIKQNEDIEQIKSYYETIESHLVDLTNLLSQLPKAVAGFESLEIQKLAQKSITRWLKRKRLSFFKNREDAMRLSASEHIRKTLDYINEFQNILEKSNSDVNELEKAVTRITSSLGAAFAIIIRIGDIHNSSLKLQRLENSKKKITSEKIDQTELNSLKRMAILWGASVG